MKNLKYFLLTCFSVLLVSFRANAQYVTGYSDLNDSDVTKALKSHITYLSSADLEGRKAGSEGEKAAADYIRTCLESYGVELLSGKDGDLFGISMQGGDTLTSRNVVGVVQGYDKTKNDRYIVVGARLDNLGVNTLDVDGKPSSQIYYGANGNASGLAVMTELARMISLNAILFRRSVVFVAFGASCQSFAGAWYFLNRSFPDAGKIDAMIDLDMLGTQSGGFYAYTASNADMNMILSQVGAELQPIVPKLTSEEPYPSDNMAFYSGEIPSVMFTTGKYPEHNTVILRIFSSMSRWRGSWNMSTISPGSSPMWRMLRFSGRIRFLPRAMTNCTPTTSVTADRHLWVALILRISCIVGYISILSILRLPLRMVYRAGLL